MSPAARKKKICKSLRAARQRLLGMEGGAQPQLPPRLQHALGLRRTKRASVAKDIAKFRQPVLGDGWQEIFLEQLDVTLGSVRLLAKLFRDRKSTRLNSSHGYISYAVFCLKKKTAPQVSSTSFKTLPYHPSIPHSHSHNLSPHLLPPQHTLSVTHYSPQHIVHAHSICSALN